MSHSCKSKSWKCPFCNKSNEKYISYSTITSCNNCKKTLSWDGTKIIAYEEWLNKR